MTLFNEFNSVLGVADVPALRQARNVGELTRPFVEGQELGAALEVPLGQLQSAPQFGGLLDCDVGVAGQFQLTSLLLVVAFNSDFGRAELQHTTGQFDVTRTGCGCICEFQRAGLQGRAVEAVVTAQNQATGSLLGQLTLTGNVVTPVVLGVETALLGIHIDGDVVVQGAITIGGGEEV